ncbi:MAG: enoyl-CoA hydratase/isomerase family protein [Acidobacteriota bacterium]
MTTEPVQTRVDDRGLRHVCLDAGRGNVLTNEVFALLRESLESAGPDESAVLLEAAGPDFSYGSSIPEHLPGAIDEALPAFCRLIETFLDHPRPILAAVQGRCFGGGLELVAACDLVFAHPQASFASPEIHLGIFAPIASVLLPDRMSPSRATALLLSGEPCSAEEARQAGLVLELDDDPAQHAKRWHREHLGKKSRSALAHAVRARRAGHRERWSRQLAAIERQYLDELMTTPDAEEGMRAFLEKRPPSWRHEG